MYANAHCVAQRPRRVGNQIRGANCQSSTTMFHFPLANTRSVTLAVKLKVCERVARHDWLCSFAARNVVRQTPIAAVVRVGAMSSAICPSRKRKGLTSHGHQTRDMASVPTERRLMAHSRPEDLRSGRPKNRIANCSAPKASEAHHSPILTYF
jgi:hypothetical protein